MIADAPSGWSHVLDVIAVTVLALVWSMTVPMFAVEIVLVGMTLVLARIWMYRPGAA